MALYKNDGGYYAIKGFLYQFDKLIIEIINNPTKTVVFENTQDINYQNYVLQIKHKETQTYSPSKIRKAVEQLLDLFIKYPKHKYCLYCYFKDKKPSKYRLSLSELNGVLGSEKTRYSKKQKENFARNFTVQFSYDFIKQFRTVLQKISSSFSLASNEKAIYYHSIIRSHLLSLSISSRRKRKINLNTLQQYVTSSERVLFYLGYSKHLGRMKYLRFIKKEHFTFNKANINNFERLFLIAYEGKINPICMEQIVTCIGKKYFRKHKSPAPYVCIYGINGKDLDKIKQNLINSSIYFIDGTYFNGDKFRCDYLSEDLKLQDKRILKIIQDAQLDAICKKIKFKEVYHFFINSECHMSTKIKEAKRIDVQLSNLGDMLKIL